MIHLALWLISATVVFIFGIFFLGLGISLLSWLSQKYRWAYLLSFFLIVGYGLYIITAVNKTPVAATKSSWIVGTQKVNFCEGLNKCYTVDAYYNGNNLSSITTSTGQTVDLKTNYCQALKCDIYENGQHWTATPYYDFSN